MLHKGEIQIDEKKVIKILGNLLVAVKRMEKEKYEEKRGKDHSDSSVNHDFVMQL